jgi:hypothetical protein
MTHIFSIARGAFAMKMLRRLTLIVVTTIAIGVAASIIAIAVQTMLAIP